jgi:hypothetical protein
MMSQLDKSSLRASTTLGSPHADESGTWAVNGESLTFNAANGDSQTDAFCVQGRELHITGFASMIGEAQGTSDVVAVKQ